MDWLLGAPSTDRGSSRRPASSVMGRWCSTTCPRVTSKGRTCPLAYWGTRATGGRDLARTSTACYANDGRPVAVEVFSGELHDDKTLPVAGHQAEGTVRSLPDRGCYGRGMVTKAVSNAPDHRRGRLDHRAESPDDRETRPLGRVPAVLVRRAEPRGDHRRRRVPRRAADRLPQPAWSAPNAPANAQNCWPQPRPISPRSRTAWTTARCWCRSIGLAVGPALKRYHDEKALPDRDH